jgi:uncharacterized membrane protein
MRPSRLLTLVALACLVLWILLAFVWPIPSGWVHVPLVAAVLLIVRALVAADAERAGGA